MSKLSKEEYCKELTGKEMPDLTPQEVIDKEKNKKILCLLGTAYSRHKAPWDNPNAEFWGVGHCLLLEDIKKMDKVFEIHLPYIYESEISPFKSGKEQTNKPLVYHANKENALFHAKEKDVTVIVSQKNDKLNSYEIFPRQELIEKYQGILPVSDKFYATNSIAWMILYAIHLNKFDEIHLYGIHLETNTEWQYERPCCEWWLGVWAGLMLAQGKKGVIHMAEESDICRGLNEYGFADIEIRRKKIQGKLEFDDKAIKQLTHQRNIVSADMNRLISERNIPIEDKIKWLKDNIDLYSKELIAYETTDKEQYKNNILSKIESELQRLDREGRELDAKISAFNGARDTNLYYLNELNA